MDRNEIWERFEDEGFYPVIAGHGERDESLADQAVHAVLNIVRWECLTDGFVFSYRNIPGWNGKTSGNAYMAVLTEKMNENGNEEIPLPSDPANHANWLAKNVPESRRILERILNHGKSFRPMRKELKKDTTFERFVDEHILLVLELQKEVFSSDVIERLEGMERRGSIERCSGPFAVGDIHDGKGMKEKKRFERDEMTGEIIPVVYSDEEAREAFNNPSYRHYIQNGERLVTLAGSRMTGPDEKDDGLFHMVIDENMTRKTEERRTIPEYDSESDSDGSEFKKMFMNL